MLSSHARCTCGTVRIGFVGRPIAALSCCCDDCQRAATRLEALPGAPRYSEPCGGTPALMFHRRAMKIVAGGDQLVPHKLSPGSPTSRMVARCCNTALYITFDRGKFWVTAFHARMTDTAPDPAYRIQTRFLPARPPADMANHRWFPAGLIARVALAWVSGPFRRAV